MLLQGDRLLFRAGWNALLARYQDIAHASSILFGAGAGGSLWRVSRSIDADVSWAMPIAVGVILLLAFVVQSVLGLQNA